MDRRDFLTSTGAAAALAATAPASAVAAANTASTPPQPHADPQKFKLGIPWPKTVSGPADMAHRLALRIKEATNGRIDFEIEGDHQADAQNSATAAFEYGSEHDRQLRTPALMYFAGLPANSGLSPTDLEAWISYGGGQELWDRALSETGMKPLLAGHLGENPPLLSHVEITGLESLQGLRVASTSASGNLLRAMGADVVEGPPSQLADAFASGAIDAIEHGSTLNAMGAGLAQHAQFAYVPGLSASGSAVALRVPTQVWQSFSDADRAIISACAREAYLSTLNEARLSETVLLKTLTARHGLKVKTMPREMTNALPNLARAIIADVASRDELSKTINASYMAFRQHIENGRFNGPTEAMTS